jgi:hypothetical protein
MGRHRRAPATTALPGASSLELLILFGVNEGLEAMKCHIWLSRTFTALGIFLALIRLVIAN